MLRDYHVDNHAWNFLGLIVFLAINLSRNFSLVLSHDPRPLVKLDVAKIYQALSELHKHFFRLFSFSIRHLFVFSIRLGRMNLIKTLFPYVLCSVTLNAIETISSAK